MLRLVVQMLRFLFLTRVLGNSRLYLTVQATPVRRSRCLVVGDSWMSSDQGGLSCLLLNTVQLFLERQSIAWHLA